jgi:GT2 family glycosyltransferase
MAMDDPLLSIIVLTWNEIELTRRCIASIRANTHVAYELIVVDNGSEKDAATEVERLADSAILNQSNRGFAAGMNQGLEIARGRFSVFLNNDTELPPQWAERLLETVEARPDVGIVVPAVTAAGNPVSVRSEPGDAVTTLPPFRHLPSAVLYLMKTDIARGLRGWGEEFQVASREDLDLLFKVWCNGLDVVLDERVLVKHVSSATARSQLPDREAVWKRNREVFVNKWSNVTTADVPRLPDTGENMHRDRIEQAHTVTYWLQQRFEVEDELEETRRANKRIVADLKAESSRTRQELSRLHRSVGDPGRVRQWIARAWQRVRRFVPEGLRRRLFPWFKSVYYRSFPEKLSEDQDADD